MSFKIGKLNIGIIGHGFIGQEVVKELILSKNFNIKILDRNRNIYDNEVNWHQSDFRERKAISAFIEDLDILIHLASSTVPASGNISGEIDIKENISAMVQILDLTRKLNPKLYIIFASSASVYGNQVNFPINELNTPRPKSFYGLQKLSIEHFLRIYYQKYKINYVSCRISNPYGHGQKSNTLQGIISIIKKSLEHENKISIYGAKECSRDFIYINDLAKAIISLCFVRPINSEVNISTGIETNISDLIGKIEKITSRNILATFEGLRETDIARSVLDNKLLKSLTKWEPKVNLDQGIEEFINKDLT